MILVCNKGAQGGGLKKRNIYYICIFDHKGRILASHTIGVISMCENYKIFVNR